jgi:predicted DNA-binding protein
MTSVISTRLPARLANMIRQHSANSRMAVANLVRVILEHSLDGQYSFAALFDVRPLDDKLDVRLPEELVRRLRANAERLGKSVSVYTRMILYAYYTKQLVLVEIGGRYTLAENHEQKKSA